MTPNEIKSKIKILLNLADRAGTKGEEIAARNQANAMIQKYNIESLFEDVEDVPKSTDVKVYSTLYETVLEKLNSILPIPYTVVYYVPDEIIQLKLTHNKNNFNEIIDAKVLDKLAELFNTTTIITFVQAPKEMTNNRTRRLTYKKYICGIEIKNFKIKE